MGDFRFLPAVALVLLILAPVVNAQERTGFAVHGGIGASLLKDRDGSDTFEGNSFGYDLGLEYRFVPRFALGVDVFSLGSASDTFGDIDTEIEANGLDFFGRLIFPVTEVVEVYGRLGSTLYHTDVTPGSADIFGEDGVSFGGGVDIGREDLALRLEGRYIHGADDESGALLTVGFSYRF